MDRYRSNWHIQLIDSTLNAPMSSQPDYTAAVGLKNHLCRISDDYQKLILVLLYQDRRRQGNKYSDACRQGPRIDPKIGCEFWSSSSSSSSWWQSDKWDWHYHDSCSMARHLAVHEESHIARFPGVSQLTLRALPHLRQ